MIKLGNGELATELKELASDLQIQDKVIFLGWRDDMPVIYADLDLVALTSLNEGTPVSVEESHSCRKPLASVNSYQDFAKNQRENQK